MIFQSSPSNEGQPAGMRQVAQKTEYRVMRRYESNKGRWMPHAVESLEEAEAAAERQRSAGFLVRIEQRVVLTWEPVDDAA